MLTRKDMSDQLEITTQIMDGQASRLEYPAIELEVTAGPDKGKRCRFDPAGTRIGTAPGSQLVLTDRTVSRLHCELRVIGRSLRLSDSGSTNGTYVDGVRVLDAEIPPGAAIRLGATQVKVVAGGQKATVDLSPRHSFGDVIGASNEMRRLFTVLEKIAPTETTVLIQGETGTGKELVARAIHDASRRARMPFVVVDCGAIAENLIESELFGHVRGAFSGAVGDRRGLFEEANGGTLFLDEIGELPAVLQPKLLRVLETFEVRRVGSNTPKRVDVRIVAATNQPLARNVNDGTFREDLYYRLAVVELLLPPLRARREDVALLARHFYRRYAGENEALPQELLSSIASRAWPGNVRELRNFVERSVSLGYGAAAAAAPAPAEAGETAALPMVPTHLPLKDARAAWTAQFEMVYVKALLAKTRGNVTRAAELAGINRRSLQRLIASLGLRADDEAPGGVRPKAEGEDSSES
jgi:DNA-binding NtrC family response regulator